MRYHTDASVANSSVSDTDLTLNVFVAYEDIAAGKRAKETCDALAGNLGAGWKVETQIVSFKMLNVAEWLEAAVNDAAKADVLVVSCQRPILARCVKDWIER